MLKPVVLCTRPVDQNSAWRQGIEREGFVAVSIPLLEIRPVSDAHQKNIVKTQILNFDNYQKIIFVSQNAVAHGVDWIEQYWPQCPHAIEWYAVGSKTASVLERLLAERLNCHVSVGSAASSMNSEELLALPSFADIDGQKICIMRGVGGRPHLADVLSSRGADIRLCEMYERAQPENSCSQLQAFVSQYGDLHRFKMIITLFSGETLDNFYHCVKTLKNYDMKDFVVLVPGERVAAIANKYGFNHILCAKNASELTMLETLLESIK